MFIGLTYRKSLSCFLTVASFALASSIAAAGQAPTQGPNPCATGYATLPGQPGGTFSSPFSALVKASTGSGCSLTAVRLYADNKPVMTYPVGGQSGGFNFQPINLSDGYHNLVGVVWDQDGYAFKTENFIVFVGNEDQTVYVNSPANNQTFTDPTVHFDIRTVWNVAPFGRPLNNSGTQVTHVRVYVDSEDVYDYNGAQVDFWKKLAAGDHYLVAIAWNASGNYIKSSSVFTVK